MSAANRATIVPSPVHGRYAVWNASLVRHNAVPPALNVKLVPEDVVLPATPTAPISARLADHDWLKTMDELRRAA